MSGFFFKLINYFFVYLFIFLRVLFGSLKGTGTPKPDGSVLGHLVQQQGIWGTLGILTPWAAGSMEAPHGHK